MPKPKILTHQEYIQSLPKQSEIPPVRQDQLRRLYEQFARGIEEPELLDEVESRMVARAELLLDITDIFGEQGDPEILRIDGRRVARVSGSGKLVYIGPEEEEKIQTGGHRPTDWGLLTEEEEWHLEDWMDKVGLRPTDFGRSDVEAALIRIIHAKRWGKFSERMLALDNLVQIIHGSGHLGTMFIDEGPMNPEEFLDQLSGPAEYDASWPRRGYRRPEVRVRGHRRRFK